MLSTPVLSKAGGSLTPNLPADEVADQLVVESVTSQLLSIQASSRRVGQAQALAQAVASAYVDILEESASSVTGETIGALRTRDADLEEQLKALTARIDAIEARARGQNSGSAAGRQDAELMDRLIADQSQLALQREKVREALAAVQPIEPVPVARVVQPATPSAGPGTLLRLVTASFFGALLVAGCAAAALLIRLRYDPRLRARDDIADAVASTVLADILGRPQRSVAEWMALFVNYEASAGVCVGVTAGAPGARRAAGRRFARARGRQ